MKNLKCFSCAIDVQESLNYILDHISTKMDEDFLIEDRFCNNLTDRLIYETIEPFATKESIDFMIKQNEFLSNQKINSYISNKYKEKLISKDKKSNNHVEISPPYLVEKEIFLLSL